MAEISPARVKELRERTGAGMMDCKKALAESGGDMEQAADWLRTKGLAAAARRAGRVAADGLVGMALRGPSGALVEVNSETDFVARNDQFQAFVRQVAALSLDAAGDVVRLKAARYPGKGHSVVDELASLAGTIGENLTIRRAAVLMVPSGAVAGYMHNQLSEGLGKIGVLVALESNVEPDALRVFGRQVAMHVAASKPESVEVAQLDKALLARERAIFAEQARASGKPEVIIEKMVEGRLRKFYEEVVLLEQTWIHTGEGKVAKAIEAKGKELGGPIRVTGFKRFALGEGIERGQADFAAEVAAQLSR